MENKKEENFIKGSKLQRLKPSVKPTIHDNSLCFL